MLFGMFNFVGKKLTPCNDADLNDILHQGEKLYYRTEVIL